MYKTCSCMGFFVLNFEMTWKKDYTHCFFKYILQRKLVSFLSMSQIAVLSKRLRSIKVPDVITWCPRSLADHGTWKGKYVSA